MSEDDISKFRIHLGDSYKICADGNLGDEKHREEVMSPWNIFTSFVSLYDALDDKYYLPIDGQDHIKSVLDDK